MRPTHLAANLLLLLPLALIASCSRETAAAAPSQTDAAGSPATLARLLGRWARTPAEDTVFGEDGALLCDGIGPLDLTGSYRLLDDKRISISWPGAKPCTYAMAFFGDTLRLTAEDSSIGDGWTLTRRR